MALKAARALEGTTEEACRAGRRCTSRDPSNPHTPITTHALYVLCAGTNPDAPGSERYEYRSNDRIAWRKADTHRYTRHLAEHERDVSCGSPITALATLRCLQQIPSCPTSKNTSSC